MSSASNALALPPLKSLRCDRESLVTFVSRTPRRLTVLWLDYQGRRVEYCQLNYSEQFHVQTFETHPWIFRDSESGDTLVTSNGLDVYWPRPWNGDDADCVVIGIPVYSLRERCMQVVRLSHSEEQILSAEIPESLKRELFHRHENTPYIVYIPEYM